MNARKSSPAVLPADGALYIARVFNAPRELVFRMWVEQEHVARWSAPHGFTIPRGTADVRPGGAWRCCMRSADGVDHWISGVYREVVAPERLVFTHAHEDPPGVRGRETLVTVTFEDLGGRTRMHFRQAVFDTVANRDGHQAGWNECFDRLEARLRSAT